MSILTLSSAQRSALRAQAHELSPLVMIGDAGLTESVMTEIERTLNAHTLIKIRVFSDDKETRTAYAQAICEKLNCALVQHIGKLLVIYRPESSAAKKTTLAQSLAGETGTKTKARACVASPSSNKRFPISVRVPNRFWSKATSASRKAAMSNALRKKP